MSDEEESGAKRDPQGIVVFEGDYGGQIYLVARAALLLSELDSMAWDDPDGARVYFESLPTGSEVAGGMGGGLVTSDLWLHPKLNVEEHAVRRVLSGQSASVLQ